MDPHLLQSAHLIDDSFKDSSYSVRGQRSLVVVHDVSINGFFAFGFVHRERALLLHRADLLDDGSALVQQVEQIPVNNVDVFTEGGKQLRCLFLRHRATSRARPPARRRVNCSTSDSSSGLCPCFSIVRTSALPTTTPSA